MPRCGATLDENSPSWEGQAPKALGWAMRCWKSPPRLPAAATPPMEGTFKGTCDISNDGDFFRVSMSARAGICGSSCPNWLDTRCHGNNAGMEDYLAAGISRAALGGLKVTKST